MINKVLFKANMKSNYGTFIFINIMLLMYTTISIGMYTPNSKEGLEGMMDMMPEAMVKAFGFDQLGGSMTQYLGSYLFGFIYLVFPVIFIVILANNLMVKHVESGSMTYLLSTPNTRKKIVLTQGTFLGLGLILVLIINLLVAIIMAELMFPGELDINGYTALNIATLGCLFLVSSFSFYISSTFEDSKKALSISAGLPMIFVVVKMISGLGDKVDFLKYLSLFSIIDVTKIINSPQEGYTIGLVTCLLGCLIYYVSIIAFDKRSLAI